MLIISLYSTNTTFFSLLTRHMLWLTGGRQFVPAARVEWPAPRSAPREPQAGHAVHCPRAGGGPGGAEPTQPAAPLQDGAPEARWSAAKRRREASVLHPAAGHVGATPARAEARGCAGVLCGI